MGAKMFDYNLMLQAGLKKPNNCGRPVYRNDYLRLLRIIDEQDAVNRYNWENIPTGLTSQELERMIYYKGQLVFFYYNDKFYFMPYALDGTIDFYGRYNTVHPVPFTNGSEKDEKTDTYKQLSALLSNIKLQVAYDIFLPEELTEDVFNNTGVILHDYTKQLSQEITPRWILNDVLLQQEADILAYLDVNLLIGTGIIGYRVNDADSKTEVNDTANAIYNSAISKIPYVATIGNIDFQDMNLGAAHKPQDYLLSMQSIENLRLSTYGIENGGLFTKKAHVLESEQAMNNSDTLNAYKDGLAIRQHFCEIVNSIWDLGIWCNANESEVAVDINQDGLMYDNETESDPSMNEQNGGNENGGL